MLKDIVCFVVLYSLHQTKERFIVPEVVNAERETKEYQQDRGNNGLAKSHARAKKEKKKEKARDLNTLKTTRKSESVLYVEKSLSALILPNERHAQQNVLNVDEEQGETNEFQKNR